MSSSSRFIKSITMLHSRFHAQQVLSSSTRTLKHQALIAPQGLGYRYLISNNTRSMQRKHIQTRNISMFNRVKPEAPLPSQLPVSPLKWIFGIMVTVVLPFVANTSGSLVKYKVEVDTVVATIEEIVDVVEKAADIVDKVAEEISDDLPEGGRLKEILDKLEDVAELTANDARALGEAIDKFQEVEGKVGSLIGPSKTVRDKKQIVANKDGA